MTDMEAVFLRWKDQTQEKWEGLLGEDAGDLISEVWLRLSRAEWIETQDEKATLTYINMTAQFCLRDMRRYRSRNSQIASRVAEVSQLLGPESRLDTRLEIEQLVEKARLKPQERVAIVGKLDGHTPQLLTRLLGVQVETLERYEREAIGKMRKEACDAKG